ncbi:MAG: carboxylate-amine ligase [Geminicoccaceae bacterium]
MSIVPPSLTLGVEEEYLLVDPDSRDLVTSQPDGFMKACKDRLGDRVGHELLQSQIEVGTPVCQDISEVRHELTKLRRGVAEIADDFGMAMVAASTHPFARCKNQTRVENERYNGLISDLRALADRMLICGMHVHAAIEDEELQIDLMNQATYFLPHLLALSTSSPFWEGDDTGLKAYRPTCFGDLPRTGLPEYFPSAASWHEMLSQLAKTGLCPDPSKIWWDIRPSCRFPTLEMRVCDVCTTLEDTVTIAALYQAILAALFRSRSKNQSWRQYRSILIAENKSLAQRYGIDSTLADFGMLSCKPFGELLDEIIELVQIEAARWGCLAEVEHARTILKRGTSADRQLDVYTKARAGGADQEEACRQVVDWLIHESVAGLDKAPAAVGHPVTWTETEKEHERNRVG